ncbi:MAG: DUF4105 domain-containing protein [Myxococcales bacterium]|nr:DUF4105 domain-containing protein [Myxococcales bacterium]
MIAALSLLASAPPALAQAPCELADGEPAVYLLTAEPTPELLSLFGHTALMFVDARRTPDVTIYDFGRFRPPSVMQMVWGYLTMTQRYHLAEDTTQSLLSVLRDDARGVVAQRLNLSNLERLRLQRDLHRTAVEDGEFTYRGYDANCTTQVRDHLDEVLGGAFSEQHRQLGGSSPATQILRHAASHPLWFGLQWGSGHLAHAQVSGYDAMFVPDSLQEGVARTLGSDGSPLVAETCQLLPVGQVPVPDEAPRRTVQLWLLGGAVGAGLAGLSVMGSATAGRVAAAIVACLLGLYGSAALLVGVLGTFAPFWGHHNLFFAHPGWLVVAAGAALAIRTPTLRWPYLAACGVLAIVGLGVVLAVARGLGDHNLGVMGLVIPICVAVAFGLRPSRA